MLGCWFLLLEWRIDSGHLRCFLTSIAYGVSNACRMANE